MELIESLGDLVMLGIEKEWDKDELRHAVACWLLAHYNLDELRDAIIGFEE